MSNMQFSRNQTLFYIAWDYIDCKGRIIACSMAISKRNDQFLQLGAMSQLLQTTQEIKLCHFGIELLLESN